MSERFMTLIVAFLLIIFFGAIVADDILCQFKNTALVDGTFGYYCDIKSIYQISSQQNAIKGTHLEGKSDIDVKAVEHLFRPRANLSIFDSILCQQFSNLEEIYLESIFPSLVDENSLKDCKNLKTFALVHAGVSGLSKNFLPSPSQLIDLNLRSNRIIQLPENILKHQSDLKELNLGENQIEFLHPNFFEPVENLRVLALDRNKIKNLNPEWFENLQNLEDLSLELNKIAELPQNIFAPLVNLRKLWLFGNQLTILHSNSFGNHRKLHILSIFNNKINAIDKKFIEKIVRNTTVHELDMSGNICSNEDIKGTKKLRIKLKTCFDNYSQHWMQNVDFNELFRSPKMNFKSSKTQHMPLSIKQPPPCGVSKYTEEDIVSGSFIEPNSFPWHVILMLNNGSKFVCSGTLVTEQKVVTAAHCIHPRSFLNPLLPEEITVILGANNFSDQNETNRQNLTVSRIFIHTKWKPSSSPYDYDIAVIVLAQPIQISHSVRPICKIPDKSSSILSLPEGIVVGYERNKNFSIPKVISIPIHTNADCHERFPILGSFLSPRMFCSGTGSGEGVCLGDSGGAVMVRHEGAFYLRGIVTSSINGGPSVCDAQTYSVFTDIIRYADWIEAFEK